MYTIPKSIEIEFDLKRLPELENRIYRILWVAISIGHIRDQFFKDHVMSVTKAIEQKNPQEFKHFLSIIRGSGLRVFGKAERSEYVKMCDGRLYRSRHRFELINKKWWRQIWNLIKYSGDIELIQ